MVFIAFIQLQEQLQSDPPITNKRDGGILFIQ